MRRCQRLPRDQHNRGAPHLQGAVARLCVDIGPYSYVAVDVLINMLLGLRREAYDIREIQVGNGAAVGGVGN